MGSKYFGRSEDLLLARQVAQGCYLGYHHSASGLAPEAARFTESNQPGKFVTDPQHFFSQYRSRMEYILRPGNTALLVSMLEKKKVLFDRRL